MNIKCLKLAVVMAVSLAPGAAGATDIYRSVAADGGVAFSDQPQPGARRVEMPGVVDPDQRAAAIAQARAATADMLEMAATLEDARLKREQLRTERALQRLALLQAARAAQPPAPAVDAYPRVGTWFPATGFGQRRHVHRPHNRPPARPGPVVERSPWAPRPFGPPAFRQ